MQRISRFWSISIAVAALLPGGCFAQNAAAPPEVGLFRVFEARLENDKAYANKFNDVELRSTYTAPSGREIQFRGFFDGDGQGGGNAHAGNVWKLRFMPDELGQWRYRWSWSDGTKGGESTFQCVSQGAGKGILQAYKDNPHWLAYNGTEPVWIKSYYETGHGSIAQPFDWVSENVFQPIVDRGYNHLQVNWLLSLCCFGQYYQDGPPPSNLDLALYKEGQASSTMRLDVWRMMEQRLGWLNDRNVGVHMFLGFEGRKNKGPSWEKLSDEEKEFYVRYVVARIAPYANIAGWNFVWEDPGHRESHELGLARLLEKYDVFNHLRTYQDEHPRDNEYQRPEYTFAAIENHYITAPQNQIDRNYRKTPWTHHQACLVAYVKGKPVYMSEGNALWRRYWAERSGATQDDLRQAAWGCATAAASFCWNGHAKEYEMVAAGPEGLPFHGDDNPYTASARYIDILSDVMTGEVAFYRMTPRDYLLTGHDPFRVWCLAELGKQYLVFAATGEPFTLHLPAGDYPKNVWIDAKTGQKQPAPAVKVTQDQLSPKAHDDRRTGTKGVRCTPPSRDTDWVLVLRSAN
jgi:hypothetical protein